MSNRILKWMLIVASGLGVLVYAGIKLGHINPNTGRFVTPIYEETLARIRTSTPTRTETSTPTFTPISESTDFYAVTALEVDCFDWSYRKLTVIEPLESVWVLGRNKQGTWYIVRWPKFTTQCWVEATLLKPGNFSQEELREISTDFPPLSTATPPLIPINPTLSPTPTRTYITYTPTPTRRPNEASSVSPGGSGNAQTQQAAALRTAQALTQQAAIFQTSQALTQQAAALQTAQALTQQAAAFQTSQALTQQVAVLQTAQALTQQAAIFQTSQALTQQACGLKTLNLGGNNNGPKVHLSWNSLSNAIYYEVFVSINGGKETSLGITSKTNMDDSIENNATNSYYVVAVGSCGNTRKSNTVKITR